MSTPTTPEVRTLQRQLSYHPDFVLPPPQAGTTQYIIVNPMHIVTLRDRSRTFAVRCVEKLREFSEKWFSHVLLILVLVGYGCLGAAIFQVIEGPYEDLEKKAITGLRETVVADLWKTRNSRNRELWEKTARYKLKIFEEQVMEVCASGITSDSDKRQWTFWGALFYSGTVFTTIGYGNICPKTTGGMAMTIVYSFIGIPLLLMVLADLGKLFTRAIKSLFFYIRQFYHTGKCRKMRRAGRKATAMPVQFVSVAWSHMPTVKRGSKGDILDSNDVSTPAKGDPELGTTNNPSEPPPKSEPESPSIQEDKKAPDFEVDDEFNLPISLALLMLVLYMMLGALIFTIWEEWTFFEAVYFVFISMSTIGFGDYVPDHPMFMMATFIYLLFGLALTSMCINVVQEKISDLFERAKLRLGTTMGLDMNAIMAADVAAQAKDSKNEEGKEKDDSKEKSDKKEKEQKKEKKKKEKEDKEKKEKEKKDLKKTENAKPEAVQKEKGEGDAPVEKSEDTAGSGLEKTED